MIVNKIEKIVDDSGNFVKLSRLAKTYKQKLASSTAFKNRLKDLENLAQTNRLCRYVLDNWEAMVTEKPRSLHQRIRIIDTLVSQSQLEAKKKELEDGLKWSTTPIYIKFLQQCFNIKTCPYCNAQSTLTLKGKKDPRVLIELDHFYPKSIYPYFMFCFYNLIPVCHNCNHIKSDDDFTIYNAFHPYYIDIDNHCQFEIPSKTVADYFAGNIETKELIPQLKVKPQFRTNQGVENRLNKHVEGTRLDEVYSEHWDIAWEILQKARHYSSIRRKGLKAVLPNLVDSEIDRLLYGNYLEKKDIPNRPFVKLTKDLIDQWEK